jgi:hypothetical protein
VPSHGINTGSNPVRATILRRLLESAVSSFCDSCKGLFPLQISETRVLVRLVRTRPSSIVRDSGKIEPRINCRCSRPTCS